MSKGVEEINNTTNQRDLNNRYRILQKTRTEYTFFISAVYILLKNIYEDRPYSEP